MAGLVFAAGCSRPSAGDACKTEQEQVCADERESLVCTDGKWERLACRGAGGCKSVGKDVSCANDSFASGDPCDPSQHEFQCGPDKVSVVRCTSKHWRVAGKCPGPRGCYVSGGGGAQAKVACDDSVADVGMPCATEGSAACSGDKTTLLKCKSGSMIEETKCRGVGACQVKDGVPTCDATIGQAGAPCNDDAEVACAADGKRVLRCRGHVMVAMEECRVSCSVSPSHEVTCH